MTGLARYHTIAQMARETLEADPWFAATGIAIFEDIMILAYSDIDAARGEFDAALRKGGLAVVVDTDVASAAGRITTGERSIVRLRARVRIALVENPRIQRDPESAAAFRLHPHAVRENLVRAMIAPVTHPANLWAPPEGGEFLSAPTRLNEAYYVYPVTFERLAEISTTGDPAQ